MTWIASAAHERHGLGSLPMDRSWVCVKMRAVSLQICIPPSIWQAGASLVARCLLLSECVHSIYPVKLPTPMKATDQEQMRSMLLPGEKIICYRNAAKVCFAGKAKAAKRKLAEANW